MNNIKIICFDLDDTLCKTIKNNYHKSIPIKKNITVLNKLYESGYEIKIFTSRFMGRSKEKSSKAKKMGYNLTVRQLKKWNIKYHKLIFGKPSYDMIVDDKALGYDNKWSNKLLKIIKRKN
jgi:hypothetical protein